MRAAVLVLLLLFNAIISFGQVHKGFRWIGPNHSLYTLDVKTGVLSEENIKPEQRDLGKLQGSELLQSELPGDFDIHAFYKADSLLITVPGTGLLYSLSIPKLKLTRLDQTFFRGYNFNASQFSRKDTLFSVGGDGFWQRHSIFTFYNPKTFEWDIYESRNENPNPSDYLFSGYSKEEDAFFSSYLNPDSAIESKKIPFMVFSFQQKEWKYMGNLTKELVEFAKKKYRSVWTGKHMIFFSDLPNSVVYLVDPFKNELYQYRSNRDHFFMLNAEQYARNGYLYSRGTVSAGKRDKTHFDSLLVEDMLREAKLMGKVYKSETDLRIYGFAIIFLVLVSLTFLIYRKRQHKQNHLKLTEQELLVIKQLFLNHPNTKVSSSDLNHLLQLDNKSYDNQRQIRNRIIITINQKLYTYFDSKDLIMRSSNNEDKRMMDYYINPEIKPKDLEKLRDLA